ncbi:Helothermine [Orbilia brochopaga]|nr:Helothermine [Drechslerella brochopaga]
MKFSLVNLLAILSSAAVQAMPASDGGIAVILGVNPKLDAELANAAQKAKIGSRGTPMVYTGPVLEQQMLAYHNAYRARHSTGPLVWNDDLANFAAVQASKCIFAHTLNNQYGENIGAGTYPNAAYYVWLFYAEVQKYNFNNPGFSKETGHFTQVNWASTTQVGCAWVTGCPGALPLMLFCEYAPRGNVLPAANFVANVKPPSSRGRLPAIPDPGTPVA